MVEEPFSYWIAFHLLGDLVQFLTGCGKCQRLARNPSHGDSQNLIVLHG